MNTPKRHINIELLLGISATFLSLAALVVSVLQTRIAREQQYASVWPSVVLSNEYHDGQYYLYCQNNGVGPAIIKKLAVTYHGKHFSHPKEIGSYLPDSTGQQIRKLDLRSVLSADMGKGSVLKSGDRIDLVSSKQPKLSEILYGVFAADTSTHFSLHYSDVYGNCWRVQDDFEPVKVDMCPD